MNQPRTNHLSPLVSVVIPCYNQAEFLDDCLHSVLIQNFGDWDCLIINDGSTDLTEKVAESWIARDSRFQYFYKDNGGLPQARNFGIGKSRGIYLLPLDADDRISPNYLKECVSKLEGEPKLSLVYGKVEQFGTRTGPWELGEYSYLDLLAYNMIHCCAMYRKDDWKAVGGYDESMKNGLEDWEFWIRLLEQNGQAKLLKKITFYYRIKDVSMITLMDKKSFKDTRAYVLRKHADIYMVNLYNMVMEKKKLNMTLKNKKLLINHIVKSFTKN